MLFGKVVRPSAFNATLASSDPVKETPGVQVLKDGDFIGVAAHDQQTAGQVAGEISAQWKAADQPGNAQLLDYLRKNATASEGAGRPPGSVADGLAAADKTQQTYTIAYIAHAPLEPRAAVAEWVDNKLTVWTGTQRPFGVRQELAEAFHISEEKGS